MHCFKSNNADSKLFLSLLYKALSNNKFILHYSFGCWNKILLKSSIVKLYICIYIMFMFEQKKQLFLLCEKSRISDILIVMYMLQIINNRTGTNRIMLQKSTCV